MRHHYLPEFLLKRWAETTADKKVEVFQLDIPRIPSKRRRPKHTGFEQDLYALTHDQVAGLEKQHVETNILKHVDNEAAKVLNKILIGGLGSLTKTDNTHWIIFLMSLRVRRPEFINYLKYGEPDEFKATLIESPEKYIAKSGDSDPHALAEHAEKENPGITDNFGMVYFGHMITEPDIAMKIGRMTWSLYHFKKLKNHLLLSDDPLILTEKSIDHPDLIIMLPLSPDKVFIATKAHHATRWLSQHRAKDVLTYINEWSLLQSKKRIIARNKSPHRFILNRNNKRRMKNK
ncbi:MAG: DUF4238 domain-containing protein [Gammaproteobacteria bacterium]|nr:DUF4238 domain-containing protein [Gammaproteobacteria bacterium]